jgi:pimeloyl-ACP methyl ester carboxylesterase
MSTITVGHENSNPDRAADVALIGFSMGTGDVARYIGTYGADRVSSAAILATVPPSLLETPENPAGAGRELIAGIQAAIATDRFAYLSAFYADFYNRHSLGDRVLWTHADEVNRELIAFVGQPRPV